MEQPLDGSTKSFDLSADAKKQQSSARAFRLALTAIAIVFFALGVYFISPISPRSGPSVWSATGVLWVVGAVMLALPWLGANFQMKPVRRGVEVSDEGVKIVYTTGEPRLIRWDDPSLGLTLVDWTHEALNPVSATSNEAVSLNFDENAPLVWFNAQIMTELISAAQAHGVQMLVRPEIFRSRRYEYTVRFIRIGDPERTPGWKTATLPRVAKPS